MQKIYELTKTKAQKAKLSIKRLSKYGRQALLIFFSFTILFTNQVDAFMYLTNDLGKYELTDDQEALLIEEQSGYSVLFEPNHELDAIDYNQEYKPGNGVATESSSSKFRARVFNDAEKGVEITDAVNEVTIGVEPLFGIKDPFTSGNRVLYELKDQKGVKVISMAAVGYKEDIILDEFSSDRVSFSYKLDLPAGTEAVIENDGSLGIYGVDPVLLGDISASTDADASLLEKALTNGEKRHIIFKSPAPYVVEGNRDLSNVQAWYELKGDILTINAQGLGQATFPLSIDPSIYVETAAKLMRGNNETNIDFDITNELIKKGFTTGARFDTWNDTMNLNVGRWNHGTAVAGGYIYVVGGETSSASTTVYSTAGTDTFDVPTGVTSITVKSWGAGGGGGGGGANSVGAAGAGAGFAQATLSVTPSETLDIYVGGGGSGGQGSDAEAGGGGGGGGYSGVRRSGTELIIAAGGGGGGGGDDAAGQPGNVGGAGGGTSGVDAADEGSTIGGNGGTSSAGGSGGSNAGTNGGSLSGGTGGIGGSGSACSGGSECGGGSGGSNGGGSGGNGTTFRGGGGGGGAGHYGGGGGGGSNSGSEGAAGGGGGSSYTTGSSTTNTAGSGTLPGNDSDSDRSGAGDGGSGGSTNSTGSDGDDGIVIISYTVTGSGSQDSIHWAELSTTNNSIISPNPGAGTCTDWCTNSVYDLPDERVGFSLVAYNGFLYVIGGEDDTGTRQSTVYIAKLGANGEPSLWHPTDDDKDNWVYWYSSSNTLTNATSYGSAVAYNNRLYFLGGQTNASSGGVTTVYSAEFDPTGDIQSWTTTGMTALPSARHSHSVHTYNDYIYLVGGNSSGTLQDTVYYTKIDRDGTLDSWTATNSFSTARSTWGGNYSVIWGGYLYIAGGCTAVNGSGYCTTIASDVQIASINADGSLDKFDNVAGVSNQRIGYGFAAWDNALYRIGGCAAQNTSSGECDSPLNDEDYAVINPDGDASTVSISEASGSGNCTGGSPYDCDLPPAGDDAGEAGLMLSSVTVINGYLYVIGGCIDYDCNGTNPAGDDADATGNIAYTVINADGTLGQPSSCIDSYYGAWCVDSTNRVNGTDGIATAGVTVFDNTIYLVGGVDDSNDIDGIYRNEVNADGSLNGSWTFQNWTSVGIGASEEIFYAYAYARANPSSAGTNPGNLFILGGCGNFSGSGIGCSGADYRGEVYKCNIGTSGAVSSCSTSGQLQIDIDSGTGGDQGVGAMAGSVYANRIYLIGGLDSVDTDRDQVIYAEFNDSNNIVAVSGSEWVESPNNLSVARRRGSGFGYNGFVYGVGGFEAVGGIIDDIEFSKVDVSDGSIGSFTTSSVVINQRWGLAMAVSNSFAYVIGGCNVGNSPGGCSSFEPSVQTFQLYNNDSGTSAGYSAASNQFNTDRYGASAVIHDGYIYLAGGCTDTAGDCSTATNNVQYASLDALGNIGSWSSTTSSLPASRGWGQLEEAGGTLYWLGGQDSAGDEKSDVYYATPGASGSISAITGLTSGTSTGTSATSSSVSVEAGDLVLVSVNHLNSGGGINTASLSGLGITWSSQTVTMGGGFERITFFWGAAPSTTSGTLSMTFGGQSQEDIGWTVSKATGYDTATPIAQSPTNNATNQTGLDVTMSAPVDSRSVYITTSYFVPNSPAGEAGYTNLYSFNTTGGGHVLTQYGASSITSTPGTTGAQSGAGNDLGIVGLEIAAADPADAGDIASWATASNGLPADRTQFGAASWNDRLYVVGGLDDSASETNTVYISPQQSSGGDISSSWSSDSDVPDVARSGNVVVAYANNLYSFGGHDGSNYLLDSQFTQINTDGTVDAWTFTTQLPTKVRQGDGFAANGYIYVIGGRSDDYVCDTDTLVAPISANTTIATGNNPTGVGEWYETNSDFSGERFGNAAAYDEGKAYVLGGGCLSDPNNTTVFSSAGADTYDVPSGVSSITVKAWGAGGGGGGGGSNGGGGEGGGGGFAQATLSVTPTETLNVYVGSGGGAGGTSGNAGDGAGGGGHSEINRSGTNLIIAGGGGGGGGGDNSGGTEGGDGGAGGGTSGVAGNSSGSATGGGAGTSGSGGSAGSGDNNGTAGGSESAGDGGNGGSGGNGSGGQNNGGQADDGDGGAAVNNYGAGGGGGGGLYGGGGGGSAVAGNNGGGGGGGGSGYVTGSSTTLTAGSGQTPGNNSDSDRNGAGDGGDGGGTGANGSAGDDGIIVISYTTSSTMTLTGSNRTVSTTLLSQPQVAKYSRLIDTDTDVFPTNFLINGVDNSIGARWEVRYSSSTDSASQWGQETDFGEVTLGNVNDYTPLDTGGSDTEFARFFYFWIEIDASNTYGYPEDVNRGPTITDITLFFTSDPGKRLRHGKTFTGGIKQPLDTPPGP